MKNKTDICCVFNLGPLYNYPIYKLMDEELNCDFYIGDKIDKSIQLFDYNLLNGFKKQLTFERTGKRYHLRGALNPLFKKQYKHIIVTGDSGCYEVWLLLLFGRIFNKKIYLWCHGWFQETSKKSSILMKIFYKLAYHVFLYGDYAREFMIAKNIKPSKLSCIYNSLDYETQKELRGCNLSSQIYKDHFHNDNPNLVYIGRIQRVKRLELVLGAMKLLKKKGIFVNFTCIGPVVEDSDLNNLAASYGLEDSLWLYGPLYEELEIAKMLKNADICVSPENVGLTVIHSLSYGLPIITNDDFISHGPEVEAIDDGVNGLFFKRYDVNSLSNAIESWLAHTMMMTKNDIENACYKVIDEKYNPNYQIIVLKEALNGRTFNSK